MKNRLSRETSPYLLQHQENPVDWYPWGEEAIERARREDKPILLSIGYSACHWCHVMAHECFENDEIAHQMNDLFINIKVDREERPDLDHIYQTVALGMTRSGGWPLTVFLTPDLKPFYGGTYFPPEDRYGRPGFPKVLKAISDAYRQDRKSILYNSEKLMEFIADHSLNKKNYQNISVGLLKGLKQSDFQKITDRILSDVDWQNGGIGSAPKFPNPMILSFLWRYGISQNNEKLFSAVKLSLNQMAMGGIFDQLGGGFHRYSVDEAWKVPHFEKMLYDNALLLKLYSEVLITGRGVLLKNEQKLYLNIIQKTVSYLLREMKSPLGLFYSAQDADSEGEEGKCFVWTLNEICEILNKDEAQAFSLRYGISQTGNFEHGKNILFIDQEISSIAQKMSAPEDRVLDYLEAAEKKLFEARSKRIQPNYDDKILTSWNGLLISGLCWASRALKEFSYDNSEQVLAAAQTAYQNLKASVNNSEYRLCSQWIDHRKMAKGNGYLDDYAYLSFAALDLARHCDFNENIRKSSNFSENYLEDCAKWMNFVLEHFKDPDGYGFFMTSDDHEKLIQRPKSVFDQAIPSGTAIALTCIEVLRAMDFKGESQRYAQEIQNQWKTLIPLFHNSFHGLGELLCFALLQDQGAVIISGDASSFRPVSLCYYPHVFYCLPSKTYPLREGKVSQKISSMPNGILICHQNTCSQPIKDREQAESILSALFINYIGQKNS